MNWFFWQLLFYIQTGKTTDSDTTYTHLKPAVRLLLWFDFLGCLLRNSCFIADVCVGADTSCTSECCSFRVFRPLLQSAHPETHKTYLLHLIYALEEEAEDWTRCLAWHCPGKSLCCWLLLSPSLLEQSNRSSLRGTTKLISKYFQEPCQTMPRTPLCSESSKRP